MHSSDDAEALAASVQALTFAPFSEVPEEYERPKPLDCSGPFSIFNWYPNKQNALNRAKQCCKNQGWPYRNHILEHSCNTLPKLPVSIFINVQLNERWATLQHLTTLRVCWVAPSWPFCAGSHLKRFEASWHDKNRPWHIHCCGNWTLDDHWNLGGR